MFQMDCKSLALFTPYGQKYEDAWTLHLYVTAEHVIPKPWALICCSNSLHSSGFSLCSRCWNLPAGISSYLDTKALQRPNTGVRWSGSGSQSMFQFIPKVLDGVEVRALCRPVTWFHQTGKIISGSVRRDIVVLKQEREKNTNCWHKAGITLLSEIPLCAVAWRFPLTGTRGAGPNQENSQTRTKIHKSIWTGVTT